MKSPPAGVKLVMHAVCMLLGRMPESLQAGKLRTGGYIQQVCAPGARACGLCCSRV